MSFKVSCLIALSSLILSVKSTYSRAFLVDERKKSDTYVILKDSGEVEKTQAPLQTEPSIQSVNWILKIRQHNADSTIITGGPDDLKNISKIVAEKTTHLNQEEKVIASLTFPGTNVLISDTLELKKIKSIIKKHCFALSPCESFEFQQPLWISPLDGNELVKSDIDKNIFIQGKGSVYMEGRDKTGDQYVCSLTRSIKDIFFQSFDDAPKSSPEKTWFFFYVYGEGNPNAHFNLLVAQSSEFVDHNRDITNFYYYRFPLDFKGWRQVGIRYSDMKSTKATNISNGEISGTKATDGKSSRKILRVQYTLLSTSPDDYVRMNMDNLLILSDD